MSAPELNPLDPPEWLFQAMREFPMQALVAAWEAIIANGKIVRPDDDSITRFHPFLTLDIVPSAASVLANPQETTDDSP